MTLKDAISSFFHYETVRIVRIRNVRVSLIYYSAQILILIYIIGYGLIFKKAYQTTGQVVGAADIKTKGVGYYNASLPWNGPSKSPGTFHVYDAYDLVLPSMEESALFVTTNMWVTKNQTREICPSYLPDNSCNPAKGIGCATLKYVQNGRQTGFADSCRVNHTDPQQLWPSIVPPGGFCDVYAWCPTELEVPNTSPLNPFRIVGVSNFTVFIRMNVNWSKFGIVTDNTAGSNVTTPLVNLWTLDQMVQLSGWTWKDIEAEGSTIGMNAVWDCNFDQALSLCAPAITFTRLDDPTSKLSSGFNYRSAEYLHDKFGARQLTKHYGVRVLVLISGVGAKFDWASMMTAIGAGIGLLSVATLFADFIATNVLQNRDKYKSAKYKEVEMDEGNNDAAHADDEAMGAGAGEEGEGTEGERDEEKDGQRDEESGSYIHPTARPTSSSTNGSPPPASSSSSTRHADLNTVPASSSHNRDRQPSSTAGDYQLDDDDREEESWGHVRYPSTHTR